MSDLIRSMVNDLLHEEGIDGDDELIAMLMQDTGGAPTRGPLMEARRKKPAPAPKQEALSEAKKLGKPFRTPGGPKKFAVYVQGKKGPKKVTFGDPNMEIKRDDPQRRKNFRSRHNCDNPGPRDKARYWSCKMWGKKAVSKIADAVDADAGPKLTEKQQKLIDGFGPAAKRLWNDMVQFPKYSGGAASDAGKMELQKKGLVKVVWSTAGEHDVVYFTPKGKKLAAKVREIKKKGKKLSESKDPAQVASTIMKQIKHGMNAIDFLSLGIKNRFSFKSDQKFIDVKATGPGLQMDVRGHWKGRVLIRLAPSDTYTVIFGRVRGAKWKVDKTVDGIYADQLGEVIRDNVLGTGIRK